MISIYLKNMAGEMIPMEVDPSSSLLEIAQQASARDPKQFPPGRTRVMRLEQEEEQKEDLTADEMLLVFITQGAYLESGVFPEGGKPYDRWVIPFRGQTLYLYTFQHHSQFFGTSSEFSASWYPEVTKPSELASAVELYELMRPFVCTGYDLKRLPYSDWESMKLLMTDVTPQEMSMLYDIVLPYYQELDEKTGGLTQHTYNQAESILCGCGAVVKRKSMRTHVHTRKHKAGVKTQ